MKQYLWVTSQTSILLLCMFWLSSSLLHIPSDKRLPAGHVTFPCNSIVRSKSDILQLGRKGFLLLLRDVH